MSSQDNEPDVLTMVEHMIDGRNEFFSNQTIRGIPYQYRPAVLSRYMNNEAVYLEFINRVYMNNIQTQSAATALITLTMANPSRNFMDPVTVTASQNQINSSLENFSNTTSSCAICQETISSGACRIRQCGHVYHRACIVNWLSMSVRCPVCRHDIREAGQASQTSVDEEQTSSQQEDQLEEHST
jgi:Ring finger domain